jgi:hypothetical protein
LVNHEKQLHLVRHNCYCNSDNQKYDRCKLRVFSSSAQQQQDLLKGCAVELLDSSTGVQIVLLGCFHGSRSSAMDVERALIAHSSPCDVIVLELCAQRFADLRRDNALINSNSSRANNLVTTADESNEGNTDMVATFTKASTTKKPWIARYVQRIQQTQMEQGWSAAVAAALLGGVSGLQTAVSSLQPGLEFITALQIAQQYSIDIVLADQAVDRTLQKMGHLFQTSLNLWKEWWITGSWDQTFGQEATALRNALWGDDRLQLEPSDNPAGTTSTNTMQVTLPSFLTRNDAAIQDLFRLIVPPFILLQAFNLILTKWLEFLFHPVAIATPVDSTITMASELDWGWIPLVIMNVFLLAMGYVSVALPATQIIIRERDDILTEGISKACQLVVKRHQKQERHSISIADSTAPPRVVAVLGLLHVNGVAQRLMKKNREWEESNIR